MSEFDSTTDVDIDFANVDHALTGLTHVVAKDKLGNRHNSGVYFQDIPTDPVTGLAVWNAETASENGFLKVDFLSAPVYRGVRDELHLIDLMTTEPPWEAFENPDVVARLFQIGAHFDVVNRIKPRSIKDLAVCIALIRPGKRHLIARSRQEIDAEIWKPDASGYYFKKSHAVAYASVIVVQLNLLLDGDGD